MSYLSIKPVICESASNFWTPISHTAYSERAGEEAAYTLMRSLSKLMDEAVRENGGVVQGFTGDGVMAVFGAPLRSSTGLPGRSGHPTAN